MDKRLNVYLLSGTAKAFQAIEGFKMQIIDKYTVPEADLTINATNDNADWASGTTY